MLHIVSGGGEVSVSGEGEVTPSATEGLRPRRRRVSGLGDGEVSASGYGGGSASGDGSLRRPGTDRAAAVYQGFFKAYQSLGRFRDGSSFKTWLLQLVVNETRNTVRSAGRRTTRSSRPHNDGRQPAQRARTASASIARACPADRPRPGSPSPPRAARRGPQLRSMPG
ncbi:sigma factor [Streptomyces sp. KLOTTS4A1]|uniref:sigma factor n=1 Tax=Streptomyces sp. KLOTTS4A1 TaxID=3390996 RepID=UPI0039F635CA